MTKMSGFLLIFILMALGLEGCNHPSNDRDWSMDQRVLPIVSMAGDSVAMQHMRQFRYRTPTDYTVQYGDQVVHLNDLQRVWFVVEPLSNRWKGLAHTLLSFEFSNGECVAISVEIRKEKGESFSPFKGLFGRYELMYVIADEEDVIGLRAIARRHDVYLYPIDTTPERARALFVEMLKRAQKLERQPEFYNTLTNTCTTNIVRHVRQLVPGGIPKSYKVLLPGYADRLAYDLKLIDHSAPFEDIRRRHWVSGQARQYHGQGSFSKTIRSEGISTALTQGAQHHD